MSNIELILERLRAATGKFLLSLQTNKAVDRKAFGEIVGEGKLLARVLKGNELLPRQVLNELFLTIGVIRGEAPFFGKDSNSLLEMANQLEMTFSLILKGECHEDRIPGVPRIV